MTTQEIAQIMSALSSLEQSVDDLRVDVRSLMDDRTWIGRLIIGAVVIAVLGVIISARQ